MFSSLLLTEAIHSTALSCGCGECVVCLAADGDEDAWAEIAAGVSFRTLDEQDPEPP
jgi:hypothetical protein